MLHRSILITLAVLVAALIGLFATGPASAQTKPRPPASLKPALYDGGLRFLNSWRNNGLHFAAWSGNWNRVRLAIRQRGERYAARVALAVNRRSHWRQQLRKQARDTFLVWGMPSSRRVYFVRPATSSGRYLLLTFRTERG